MKDRIRKIMESQHMSQKVFAQFTGISEGSLSGVFNDRTRPTLQMIESIHACLPTVSVEWMMFGTGPMYLDEKTASGTTADSKEEGTALLPNVLEGTTAPSLFNVVDDSGKQEVSRVPHNVEKTVVKYIDKPERRITEIRIFYDDQTWETFLPKR